MTYNTYMENKTATLPQEDWGLVLSLLQEHSDRYRSIAKEDNSPLIFSEILTNAAAETDDLYFRIQQQVNND